MKSIFPNARKTIDAAKFNIKYSFFTDFDVYGSTIVILAFALEILATKSA